ncbi:MAG: cation diffusion facilitator family transporter [Clostridia bacterium]|nr:cation diffusion facilitator family transporter [Clostridia bacterium]
MTELLLRLFVKDYKNSDSPAVRTRVGKMSGIVGILCNLLLFAGKLTAGILSGAVSVTADAINNLSDASSSVVTLLGFKLAAKPADAEHPYGHYRIEYLSGLIVSGLILVIGFELAKTSVEKIITPTAVDFSVLTAVILGVSILVKLWMAIFNTKLGKHIGSASLCATAADSRNDVISTAAVLAVGIVSMFVDVPLDGYIGLAVALFILWSGVGIARETIAPLLGEAPDEELVHSLSHKLKEEPEVLGIHDLMVHDYGPGRRFASVHVEVDYRKDVLDAHEMIDDLERKIKEEMNVDLVIHYDPIVTDDEEINEMKVRVDEALKGVHPNLAFHDFRMVRGQGHTNLIFDVVLPLELENKREEVRTAINGAINFGDKRYFAVLTFDSESFNDPHTR